MRNLVIDPFHGAAGDMILGALLNLGADQDSVIRAMTSVVDTPTIEIVSRAGIRAVKVHTHAGPSARTLDEVLSRVRAAEAPSEVIEMAESVFRRIAEAEASVHGKMDHFHEVGADDAIADVLGSCMALHSLSPDRIEVLPVATGLGTVRMAHGIYPVPAPATAAILAKSNLTVTIGGGQGELCTPTGAALLAEFCTHSVSGMQTGSIEGIGYGAGDRDDPDAPNVIRMILMAMDEGQSLDMVEILETNVDDVSGEIIGSLLSLLMDAGSRDACAIPILMKKGRPGHLIRVICYQTDTPHITSIMAKELGTLGIRCIPAVHRFIADRKIDDIILEINGISGTFPVKYGMMGEKCYTLKAEFDPVFRFAKEHNLPVKQVLREVEKRAWEKVQ